MKTSFLPGAFRSRRTLRLWALAGAVCAASLLSAKQSPPPMEFPSGGAPVYVPAKNGDRAPDFSGAGYGGGGVSLPEAKALVLVSPGEGDAGARLQEALDYVARQAPGPDGLRGAVQLAAGRYEIGGQLKISADGVVLRGAGAGEDGTVLVATGTDRRALILARGSRDRKLGKAEEVLSAYVPVGASELSVASGTKLKAGDRVLVSRTATASWLNELGMDVAPARQQFAWKPAAMTLVWERTVLKSEAGKLVLDAPLTTALDAKTSPASVARVTSTGRLRQVGVENLRCESTFDASNPLDEQHSWEAVTFDWAEDSWIDGVTAVHFAGSAFNLGQMTRRVTVQDCASLAPVSELGGYRRHTFHTSGEQTLFLRCRAEDGRNDFTVGYRAGGPNVFLQCVAERSHGFSGSVGSWASGTLFDNVTLDGGTLELNNRETWNQGVGWASANSVLWQCSAPVVICRAPPGAQNWAVGVWGQFVGDGWWSQVNEFVRPDSLYRSQLAARLGSQALVALEPRQRTLRLDTIPRPEALAGYKQEPKPAKPEKPLALKDGVLTLGGERLSGGWADVAWWRGYLFEHGEPTLQQITRFAPGKTGPLFTDDLDELTDNMLAAKQVVLRHHYGLWYERRRMDHERMRRPDGDVWPPFYEQPFARSGKGQAWDGLSRYDLTRYNPWYFGRLLQFAQLARAKGLVLVNEMYFQHNIIEAGAHWVDFPWRPTNNINGTHFQEPPPFDGDTIKMAAAFYDLSDPAYRALHRAYIRHHLDVLGSEPNVIHTLSAENSGPLHFMQFWLDVVAEWEAETGKHPLIALSACKDVQDAILADPKRAAVVDVIDLTYWFRSSRGKEFAPKGGTDMAPRQHLRFWKDGRPNAATIAEMAQEYRAKFPGKAVISGLPEAQEVQPR